MIHPSYSELMQVVNKDTEIDEPPVVNSRYSIVLATSKRARQIIGGDTPLVPYVSGKKPLSVAIDELYEGKVKIVAEDKNALEEQEGQEQSKELSVQEISEFSELSDEPEALENLEEPEELPEEPKEEQLL